MSLHKVILCLFVLFLLSCKSNPNANPNSSSNANLTGQKTATKLNTAATKTVVNRGDRVSVYYKGSYPGGEVFDSREEGFGLKPITFVAGVGMMIEGFDRAVLGMGLHEEKEVVIDPVDAYGVYKKSLLKKIAKNDLKNDFVPTVGARIRYPNERGSYGLYPIIQVTKNSIVVDLNHKMAGRTLIFSIKVAAIK